MRLGGQALLAQKLPSREEFGGLITNLEQELNQSNVQIQLGKAMEPEQLLELGYEHIILATGAQPYKPKIEVMGEIPIYHAHDILEQDKTISGHILIYDLRGDWVGPGMAELFAQNGAQVTLAINGLYMGETLHNYVRDSTAARLHELGVKTINYARLFGVDESSAYFQHNAGLGHIEVENINAVVLATGGVGNFSAEQEDLLYDLPVTAIGDCLAARTAEEAVYEGYKAAINL